MCALPILDAPLTDGNWTLLSASDVAWSDGNATPVPMTRADMDRIRDQFVAATRIALDADFDMVELHAAHGYLLSSRSEEHTSELQSLMRISYAVFCLKKNTQLLYAHYTTTRSH